MDNQKVAYHVHAISANDNKHKENQSLGTKRPPSSSTTANESSEYDKDKPKRPRTAYNFFFRFERDKILGKSDGSSIDLELLQRMETTKRIHRKGTHSLGFRELTAHVSAKWKALGVVDRVPYNHLAERDMKRYTKQLEEWKKKCKERQFDVKQKQDKKNPNNVQGELVLESAASYEGHQKIDELVNTPKRSTTDFTKWSLSGEIVENTTFDGFKMRDKLLVDVIHHKGKSSHLERVWIRTPFREKKASKALMSSIRLFPLETLRGDLFSCVFAFLDSPDLKKTVLVSTALRHRILTLISPSGAVNGTMRQYAKTYHDDTVEHISDKGKNDERTRNSMQQDSSNTSEITPLECGSCKEPKGSFTASTMFSPLLISGNHARSVNCGEFERTDEESKLLYQEDSDLVPQLPQKAHLRLSQKSMKVDNTTDHQEKTQQQKQKTMQSLSKKRGNPMQTQQLSRSSLTSGPVVGVPASETNKNTYRRPKNTEADRNIPPRLFQKPAAKDVVVGATRGQHLSDRQIIIILGSRLRDLERNQQEVWSMIKQERKSHAAFRDRINRKNSLLEEALEIEKQQVVESENEAKHLKTQFLLFKT